MAPVRGIAQDVIPAAIGTRRRKHIQHVVLLPAARVCRNLQQAGQVMRQVPAQKTLRPHILERIRQARKPAVAHLVRQRPLKRHIVAQRASFRVYRIKLPYPAAAPRFVNPVNSYRIGPAAYRPLGRIHRTARRAADNHLIAQRPHHPHHGRAAHRRARLPQAGQQVRAAQRARLPQHGQKVRTSRFDETIHETILPQKTIQINYLAMPIPFS